MYALLTVESHTRKSEKLYCVNAGVNIQRMISSVAHFIELVAMEVGGGDYSLRTGRSDTDYCLKRERFTDYCQLPIYLMLLKQVLSQANAREREQASWST